MQPRRGGQEQGHHHRHRYLTVHNEAPYKDSSLFGSTIEEEAKSGPDALFGQDADPLISIQKETPAHRTMIHMRVLGHSLREIARATNYTPEHVGNVLRQPWARTRINELLAEAGAQSAVEMIERAVPAAVLKKIELLDCGLKNVEDKASSDIIDRYLGKAKERIEHSGGIDLDHMSDKELAALIGGTTFTATQTPEPTTNPTTTIVHRNDTKP